MKAFKTFFILFLIVFSQQIYAQCVVDDCDPLINSLTFSDACTNEGQTATMTVGWSMSAASGECQAPAGSWQILIQLPVTEEYGVVDATTVTGPEFTWTYDSTNKLLKGVSNMALGLRVFPNATPYFVDNGIIVVTVTAVSENGCTTVGSIANIGITTPFEPNSCTMAFNNSADNDSQSSAMGVDVALPISLLDFNVTNKDCSANELTWSTAVEVNNKGFEIERSTDGRNFDVIDFVPAAEETVNGEHLYSYLDSSIKKNRTQSNQYFYRLKQIDFDNHFEIFDVVSVKLDCREDFSASIYPIPAYNTLIYKLTEGYYGHDLQINVFAGDGKLVIRQDVENVSLLESEIDISSLAKGMYRINFTTDNGTREYKFIKMK